MGPTLAESGLFPPSLIEVGDRPDELRQTLQRVADDYQHEVDHSLRQVAAVVELAIAALVVFTMAAVLLPVLWVD